MFSSPDSPLRYRAAYAIAALTVLHGSMAYALPDDREQPIRITADQAVRDEKLGFTRYKGNVVMDQGSLHIEAGRVTIYHEGPQADKIVAEGDPARLQQQPDPQKSPVKAQGNIIEYYKSQNRVQLRLNAHIEQDGSIVTGDKIDYYISEQRVKADSDAARGGSRVEVVIPAQATEQTGGDNGATDSE
jgi:lipopolysaccharide export system protein LptA